MLKILIFAAVCLINSAVHAQMKPGAKSKSAPDTGSVVADEAAPVELLSSKKWHVAFLNPRPLPGVEPLPAKPPFEVVTALEFTGPFENHPFLLGHVKVDGTWAIIDGYLTRSAGRNAALKLATADQFELEGRLNNEGLGGFFLLLGWEEGHGYAVYNCNLKTSGSPWHVCEFRGGSGVESTHQETARYECRGVEAFRLRVADDLLTMQIETTKILENFPLRNYNAGQVIIGTYDTKYGAKPLKIQSLRLRGLEVK